MYIRRYLIVSYIVSLIFSISLLYYDECLSLFILDREEELLVLDIPRIKLRRKVYNIGSKNNNVDYNIEILNNSNIENDLYFIASHSGSGRASYFDDLVYLSVGDLISLKSNDSIIVFVVKDMYYIDKNGYFNVSYNINGRELFLITCSLNYINRQLIVRAELIYKC